MPGSTSTTGEGGADVGGGVGSTAADEECVCDVWALSTTRADDEHAASADIVIATATSPPRLPVMECSFRAGMDDPTLPRTAADRFPRLSSGRCSRGCRQAEAPV